MNKMEKKEQYIIFKDGEMMGYLTDKNTAKRTISDLADYLIEEIKRNSNMDEIRIFRENVDLGIKIYTQILGQYFNGAVVLQHNIIYKTIPEYKSPENV